MQAIIPLDNYRVDYLIIGAGATAISFVDTLLDTHPQATVLMIDRRSRIGGHWVDAYPFVRLHQPATYYGVRSMKLGSNHRDLVSKFQILGYYDRVLTRLQNTGRFKFLGQYNYQPNPEAEGESTTILHSLSILNKSITVTYKTLVDTTYMQITIPSLNPPKYEIEPQANVVPINQLAYLKQPQEHFVVIGAGKTGIDAILYLLNMGVDPQKIMWVISRDAWLIKRDLLYPDQLCSAMANQLEVLKTANSIDDLMFGLEKVGYQMRLDTDRTPTAYRCATVSLAELSQLKRIEKVIRLGRVKQVYVDHLVLDQGEVPIHPKSLIVDCTSDGLARRPSKTIFEKNKITLQNVIFCQPTFSASILGYLEGRFQEDLDKKNKNANPVLHPNVPLDFLTSSSNSLKNSISLASQMPIWLSRNRLNLGHHISFFSSIKLIWYLYRDIKSVQNNITKLMAFEDQKELV
ncbi:MAG: hypothetical protein MK212_14815 [Saprospiraceae bacterium]|nr:hypothetical protein [Saprospiraceae bacterium]